ncbi:MAG: hypothetical protein IJ486_07320 [Firmicutes bacterium]|nr:hypothetical protein [Bacillota bacterium]
MTGKNMMGTALGVGLASAALGMYIYNNSKPAYQKKIKRGVNHAVDEVSDAMGHVSDTVRKNMM